MRNKNVKCLILGQKDFGEKNKNIILYCEEFGKIRCVAKGTQNINSRMIGHLQTLNYVEACLYHGPRNIIITEINTLKSFPKIRENLNLINYSMRIIECSHQLIYQNQTIPGTLQMIVEALEEIENNHKPDIATLHYIVNLLEKVGLIPDLENYTTGQFGEYFSFFNYIKNRPHRDIRNIKLNEEQEKRSFNILKRIIERETERGLSSF